VVRVFADAARDFGRAPNAVAANTGINVPPGPLAQFGDEPFRQLVEVNIVGTFNVLCEAARQVADGGAIVALTTSMVRHAVPGGGPYTASKSALDLGVELRLGTAVTQLLVEGGRVIGVEAESAGNRQRLSARQGVILASGGLSHDAALRCAAATCPRPPVR